MRSAHTIRALLVQNLSLSFALRILFHFFRQYFRCVCLYCIALVCEFQCVLLSSLHSFECILWCYLKMSNWPHRFPLNFMYGWHETCVSSHMEMFSYRWCRCPQRVVRFKSFSSSTYSLAIVVSFTLNFGFFLSRISSVNVDDFGDDIFRYYFLRAYFALNDFVLHFSAVIASKRACILRTLWYVCRANQY